MKQATELRAQRDKYLSDRIADASIDTIAAVQNSLAKFDIRIRQIHIKDVDLVDRCESCHLGTREPVALTAAAMGGEEVFASHPEQGTAEDPRSRAVRLHALPRRQRRGAFQRGEGARLQQVLAVAAASQGEHRGRLPAVPRRRRSSPRWRATLNAGREIFRLRGCMGCHRYEGFDREADEMTSVNQQIRQLEQQKAEWLRQAGFDEQKANNPRTSDAEAKKLFQESNDLKVRSSGLDAKIEQLDMRSHELVREVKKVGPSLKEVRMKLRKEWIPVWLKDPHDWREGTKMPTFRLDDDEIHAIAAFIWQSGVQGTLPQQKPGDPEKGKEAFETRGCMACHSMGEGGQKQGGTFAANLSREGEKANYDYLVRWVHNPRQRTAALLRLRKEGPDRRRLQAAQPALRLRPGTHQVPQRRA